MHTPPHQASPPEGCALSSRWSHSESFRAVVVRQFLEPAFVVLLQGMLCVAVVLAGSCAVGRRGERMRTRELARSSAVVRGQPVRGHARGEQRTFCIDRAPALRHHAPHTVFTCCCDGDGYVPPTRERLPHGLSKRHVAPFLRRTVPTQPVLLSERSRTRPHVSASRKKRG